MNVAIIGTGISGVTLALRLQQLGIPTTVFSDRSVTELSGGHLENLVARFPATQQRERELGVAFWDDVDGYASSALEVDVVGAPLGFTGRLDEPARAVDFRVYLSRLTGEYLRRGGSLVVGKLPVTEAELVACTSGHDVVVVAAGRSAPVGRVLFPAVAERSPYAAPQRRLIGGLFAGVAPTDPAVVSYNIVPGGGEIFCQPFLTRAGVVASILIEAVPSGALEDVTHLDPSTALDVTSAAIADTIDAYAPALAARIDRDRFAALGPLDVLAGAVTPVVRRGWCRLADGRIARAIGDAWIANDPITGQGANIGSHCAWQTAEALAGCGRPDESFAAALEDELWSFAGPVTAWTNAFLQPPPPHVLELIAVASAHQAVADAFAQGFADPVRLAVHLSTPESTRAMIDDVLVTEVV